MPGFDGYNLIDAGNGVFTSVSIFDTEAHAEESTRIASTWMRDEKLETALTNPPPITAGSCSARHGSGSRPLATCNSAWPATNPQRAGRVNRPRARDL